MGSSGLWRRFGALLVVAIAYMVLSMGASTPAAAFPVQAGPNHSCPAGWDTYISSGPLNGFCGQDTINNSGVCPSGWVEGNYTYPSPYFGVVPVCFYNNGPVVTSEYWRNLLTELGFTLTWANVRQVQYATGMSGEESFSLGPAGTFSTASTSSPGAHLGMHVSPNLTNPIDGYVAEGVSVTHGGGYGVTDSAGLLAAGTTIPGFKESSGSGGITGSYDASRYLLSNQSILFRGFFDYGRNNFTFGGIPGLPIANAGSAQTDSFMFGGSLLYQTGATYLRGGATFEFGRGTETQNATNGTGSFSTSAYSVDARLGHIFEFINTTRYASSSNMLTKAPPDLAGGYAVGIDISGHLGYSDGRTNGFTDSSGASFGNTQVHYGDIGARAKLFAVLPNNGWLWIPYVAGTLDQQFGFSATMDIPSQVLVPGGDFVSVQVAPTFWGTELGLDARYPTGWIVGVKGFYQASADTSFLGGRAYVKVPLNYTPRPAFATRY